MNKYYWYWFETCLER